MVKLAIQLSNRDFEVVEEVLEKLNDYMYSFEVFMVKNVLFSANILSTTSV